jgi:hypothetical protein
VALTVLPPAPLAEPFFIGVEPCLGLGQIEVQRDTSTFRITERVKSQFTLFLMWGLLAATYKKWNLPCNIHTLHYTYTYIQNCYHVSLSNMDAERNPEQTVIATSTEPPVCIQL